MYREWDDFEVENPTDEDEWFEVKKVLVTVDEIRDSHTYKSPGGRYPIYCSRSFVEVTCDAYDWTIDKIASLFVDGDHYRDEIADFLAGYDFEGDETLGQIKDEFLGQHRVEVGVHPNGMLDCGGFRQSDYGLPV